MWTTANTEGFTQDELDAINRVRNRIQEHAQGGSIPENPELHPTPWSKGEIDWSNIDDAINNAWEKDIDEDDLQNRAMTSLGL